jgi:hypothetical protein
VVNAHWALKESGVNIGVLARENRDMASRCVASEENEGVSCGGVLLGAVSITCRWR